MPKRKFLQLVVGIVLGDVDIVVRTDNNSLMIEFSDMCELDDDCASEVVIQILCMPRDISLSTRNMLKLERQCMSRELLAGRDSFCHTVLAPWRCRPGLCRGDLRMSTC